LDFIQAGDTLVVTRLDRLGRSTRDVLNIVHELDTKGAFLRVLDRKIDTSKPEGKLILTVLSMVSEMELSFIRERQKVGIEKAKAKGVYRGRPASIETDKLLELKGKGLGATAIARELGCTRSAVYKALERIAG
jgi:DNA invertase Pin-like site-specific DNA recombinase